MNVIKIAPKLKQMPLSVKWEKMTEWLIAKSICDEQNLIDQVSWELTTLIVSESYQNFIDIFNDIENKRIARINLFLEQTK